MPGIVERIYAYRNAGYFHPDEIDQLIEVVERGRRRLAGPHPGQLHRPLRAGLAELDLPATSVGEEGRQPAAFLRDLIPFA